MIPLGAITLYTTDTNVKVLTKLEMKSMSGRDALGRPFQYELELVSLDTHLDLGELLGKPVTVRLELPFMRSRFWNGIATDVGFAGSHGRGALYRVILQPQLSLLERTSNCRIFQRQTVPAIVKAVFAQHGFSPKEALHAEYAPREFVVQYEETDFDFVSRLLEQEGIYYFFRHSSGAHELVLADSSTAHTTQPGYESMPYYPPDAHRTTGMESIDRWELRQRLVPAGYAAKDYDFERPRVRPESPLVVDADHALPGAEIFDYAGAYLHAKQVEEDYKQAHHETQRDVYVRVRLEEIHASYEQIVASSNARGLTVGSIFKLQEFPRPEQNRDYLIVSSHFQLRAHNLESGELHAEEPFRCTLGVLDVARPFRPLRTTRKPYVRGPQTARVVGPEKHEIWTDTYGRVKVLFNWDRYGEDDGSCSCWVRVAQVWAGNGWGGMHIPRVGQEVIVEFLEGDPDRPVVTGRLYNIDNPVPYTLPAHQTQSGIKSRSTPGGGPSHFNEIRFEDKKGHEELYIQAEKTQNTLVKADQHITVGDDRTLDVTGNDTTTVKKDRTVLVDGREDISILKERQIEVTGAVNELYGNTHTIIVTKEQVLQASSQEFSANNGIQLIQSPATGAKFKDETALIKAATSVTLTCGEGTTIVCDKETINLTTDVKIRIKCGQSSIIVTGSEIEIAQGGSTVVVGPAGVNVTGAMIKLNS